MKPKKQEKLPFTALVISLTIFIVGVAMKIELTTPVPNTEETQYVVNEEEEILLITEEQKTEESSTAEVVTTTKAVEEKTTAKVVETTTKVEKTTKAKPPVKIKGKGVSYTQAELDFMAAAICQEAGGESRYIKVRVANVMVNRVLSDSYPNTVEGVLTDRKFGKQYDLYTGNGGRNFPDWATEEIKTECYDVARSVLSGEERPFPEKVLFQAAFSQGSGTYEHCDSVLGGKGYYFCY